MFSARKINAIIGRCVAKIQRPYWWQLPLSDEFVSFRFITNNAVSVTYNLLGSEPGHEVASCEYTLPDQRRFYVPLAIYAVTRKLIQSGDVKITNPTVGFETKSFRYQLTRCLYSQHEIEFSNSFFEQWRDYLVDQHDGASPDEREPEETLKPNSWLPIVHDDDTIEYDGIKYCGVHADAPRLFRVLIERFPHSVAVSKDPATEGIVLSRLRKSLAKEAKPLDDLIKSKSGGGTWLER